MKIINVLVLLIGLSSIAFSQNEKIEGKWYSELSAMGQKLKLNLIVKNEKGILKAELESPDQNAFGIKVDSISFLGDSLFFNSKRVRMNYNGKLVNDEIVGVFFQGIEIDLVFRKDSIKKTPLIRPQLPKEPFGYYTEEVVIKNKKVNLAGTLTLPDNKGKYPVVILISGSGPQDRNSEIFGHKPFLVLADYLAKKGIGSFRYDDRGVGKSTGSHSESDLHDFYSDAKAIVKKISKRKEIESVGVLGHSEGGIIAPWLASDYSKINFVVILAGPGVSTKDLMHEQRELIFEASGVSEEEIAINKEMFVAIDEAVLSIKKKEELTEKVISIVQSSLEKSSNPDYKTIGAKIQVTQQMVAFVTTDWYKSFISVKPSAYLSRIKQPVLALNGDKDLQVAHYQNIPAIEEVLKNGKTKIYETKVFIDLNHLFQKCEKGTISEYGKIEETMNEEVMNKIATWISSLPK